MAIQGSGKLHTEQECSGVSCYLLCCADSQGTGLSICMDVTSVWTGAHFVAVILDLICVG